MQGIWSKYVEDDLIPRINGFELLMASYAMAHLKLDMLLTDTGYVPTKDQRLKVFLTNSLEEPHSDSGTLWGNILSDESDQANEVKRDTPVMCVIGNPPYSGESANKGDWIMKLMEDYKKEPGGGQKLKERNPKWINDDYVKFLRYGQHYIEKNGQGILAFINPHGFLDNPTFRGMRWHLLKTYDKIYTIDLHGNSKKKETARDGSADVNVFDIMQGVSINIFIKTGKKKSNELGQIYHFDLLGKRDFKYDFLTNNSIKSIDFNELINTEPNYFMIQKNLGAEEDYTRGCSIGEVFIVYSAGVVTSRDSLVVGTSSESLSRQMKKFFDSDIDFIKSILKVKENQTFKIDKVLKECEFESSKIKPFAYRPFDNRYVYYDLNFIERFRGEVMNNMYYSENLGLMSNKKVEVGDFAHSMIYKGITESHAVSLKEINYLFPLYLYPKINGQQTIDQSSERTPNLNPEIVYEIGDKLGLTFTNEKETTKDTFAPIDILDYIYAVLHSPTYREKYKEFLKIDFPRVPYPKDQVTFWKLVKLGGEIRQIHLLESPVVDKPISKYPITGTNIVGKIKYEDGKVIINDTQYFEDVPEVSWNFYIGGYQPAQKWLKDRKDRELQVEDIRHYLKIIVALFETDRLMKEIDLIEFE
jgi:predicted helicase